MTDGTGREINVMAYPHPASRAAHAGIYNVDINQAAARARRILRMAASPAVVNIFANAVPDHPVDVILESDRTGWFTCRPAAGAIERGAYGVAAGRPVPDREGSVERP